MRPALAGMIAILIFALTGCALPRMVYMGTVVRDEVPIMQGGKRVKTAPQGWIHNVAVTVRIKSPLPPEETLSWYKEKLLAEGWVLRKENVGWTKEYGTMDGNPCYYAARRRWHWGKTPLSKEELQLILKKRSDGSEVEVQITGDYAWDWPGKIIYQATSEILAPPGYAIMHFVEVVGGGYTLYGILVAPLALPLAVELVVL